MAAGDLCTTAEAKQWLGITVATDDTLFDRLVTACSAGIKDFVQRPLLTAFYTESYNGTGTPSLVLRNSPITAVSSLVVNGVTVQAAANPQSFGYLFKDSVLYLSSVGFVSGQLSGQIFPPGNLNVVVAYTAGYALVPDDIRQACIEFVSYKYMQRKHIGQKTANIQAGGMGTSYQEGYMPPEVSVMLKKYRRLVPT